MKIPAFSVALALADSAVFAGMVAVEARAGYVDAGFGLMNLFLAGHLAILSAGIWRFCGLQNHCLAQHSRNQG